MARGSKVSYTPKQRRQAEYIEERYQRKGVTKGEAGRRAWATVNKDSGGRRSGSGRPSSRAQARSAASSRR